MFGSVLYYMQNHSYEGEYKVRIFLSLTFLFAVGAAGGWVLELVFRRIVHKKWINPGFLHGPYLPIYGFGLVALCLIAEIPLPIDVVWIKHLVQILIIGVAMTAIEYVSGIVFIKGMGIKLWDYSDRFGNVQGIICPLFSFLWTAVGAVYVLLYHESVMGMLRWFTGNLYYSFFVGILFGLLVWDTISTFRISEKIRKIAKEERIVVKYEELKLRIRNYFDKEKLKYNFLRPWRNTADKLRELVKKKSDGAEDGKDADGTDTEKP